MRTTIVDECLNARLPTSVSATIRGEAPKELASVMGGIHGYAIEQALRFKRMSLREQQETGLKALQKLQKIRLITEEEAEILSGCLKLLDHSQDLAVHLQSIKKAHHRLHSRKRSKRIALMLVDIALDSVRRDLRRQHQSKKSRKGGHGGARKSKARQVGAWFADVGAGAAGAVVGAAVSGGLLAFVVGAVAASGASAAVLT